jgi:hypothetical protein
LIVSNYAPVAQQIEQSVSTRSVEGAIPSRGTINNSIKGRMPRPLSISNDQLSQWTLEISEDPFLGEQVLQHPIFKEVLLAGKWLSEQLSLLQCQEELIVRITYTAGQLSFGRSDPWEIVENLLQQYQQGTLQFEE